MKKKSESTTIPELILHPELESFQKPLSRAEVKKLKKSILDFGCHEAILIWKGIVIDGHQRYSICKKHKIPFKTIEADFKSIEDAKLWLYETQLSEEERLYTERPQPVERSENPVPDKYLNPYGPPSELKEIELRCIRIDLDTQSRVKISQKTIKEYVEAMKRGDRFPAITVYQIEGSGEYILIDGFHRYYSYMEINPEMLVPANVRKGTLEEARWASFAENQKHGLQRSAADKKKSISQVLQKEQGEKMPGDRLLLTTPHFTRGGKIGTLV